MIRRIILTTRFLNSAFRKVAEYQRRPLWRSIEATLIGGAFIAVGFNHFTDPHFFEAIVPRWFWSPSFANQVSGAAEIFLGATLIPIWTRRYSAWGLLVLLILVYPANIDMFINDVGFATDEFGNTMRVENMSGVFVRNLIRLPFQFVFAWLIWRHTRKTSSIHSER